MNRAYSIFRIIFFLCCVLHLRASDEQGEAHQDRVEFVHLLGSTLEDGFFGGVKWGIAAAFYHIFYRTMAMIVSDVPSAVQLIKRWYLYMVDSYMGRPSTLNIHELQVLVTLLQESLNEYEPVDIISTENRACAMLYNHTLTAVMKHIHDYVILRLCRYTDPYTDHEIVFMMQLIAKTIDSILGCIECLECHKEVMVAGKTTVVLMQRLIALLQGPIVEINYDPSMAWFSNQRGFYVASL